MPDRKRIPFTKMEGLGNDYLFIDRFAYKEDHDWGKLSKSMSDRNFGAGSCGIILVERGTKADFRMRIFNQDGSEGDMCGNGLRCFARLVKKKGYTKKREFKVSTKAGTMGCFFPATGEEVLLDLGEPVFCRKDIPLLPEKGREPAVQEEIIFEDNKVFGTALFLGNPFFISFIEDVSRVPLDHIGPKIENHPKFPQRTNVVFAKVESQKLLSARVWERGSGITLACGTGAAATVVAGTLEGMLIKDQWITVKLPGGCLRVKWEKTGRVLQLGPAREVYEGVFYL